MTQPEPYGDLVVTDVAPIVEEAPPLALMSTELLRDMRRVYFHGPVACPEPDPAEYYRNDLVTWRIILRYTPIPMPRFTGWTS